MTALAPQIEEPAPDEVLARLPRTPISPQPVPRMP